MRRLLAFGLAAGLITGACSSGGDPTTTVTLAEASTDADTPFFETTIRPAVIDWRRPAGGPDEPAFVVAVDAATGAEEWRLEVPWGARQHLQVADDRLFYSYSPPGDESLVVALGLDGDPMWQATTNWLMIGPLYATADIVAGLAWARDESVHDRFAVVALDAADGELRWSTQFDWLPEGGPNGRMTAGDGAIYLARRSGRVIAFETSTGARRWSVRYRGRAFDAPLFADGSVIVGTGEALVALNAADASETWNADSGGRKIASPRGVASGNGVSWFGRERGGFRIAAAEVATGLPRWTASTYMDFRIGESTVVGFRRGEDEDLPSELIVWDAADGTPLADVRMDGAIQPSTVVPAGSIVYAGLVPRGGVPGRIVAIDVASGAVSWEVELPGAPREPALGQGTIYVPMEGDPNSQPGIVALDRASGDELWTFTSELEIKTHPLIVGTTLFVVTGREGPEL